jgi:hypothetical protein
METESQPDMPPEESQYEEDTLARLQPESLQEERLARQIMACRARLEQITQRLVRAWNQLQHLREEPGEQSLL